MTSIDEYWFKSKDDKDRLVRQHDPLKQSMGGRLVIAPIDLTVPGLRILDTGTSDGYWLFDFQRDHTAPHTLVGTDVDTSRFPKELPPGMTLLQQDMHQPYPVEWKESFDLVHQRLVLAGSRGDPRKPLMPLLELVKPGGWVQLIECNNTCGLDDGPAQHEFVSLMTELLGTIGTPPHMSKDLAGWLSEAGFVKIGEMLAPYAIGPKCPFPNTRDQSIQAIGAPVADLSAMAQNVPGLKCLTVDQLKTLPVRHQEEMRERGAYFPMTVVWGQKPIKT